MILTMMITTIMNSNDLDDDLDDLMIELLSG